MSKFIGWYCQLTDQILVLLEIGVDLHTSIDIVRDENHLDKEQFEILLDTVFSKRFLDMIAHKQ